MEDKNEIQQLRDEVQALKNLITKNSFSNREVFNVPVMFRRPNMYPTDNTSIASGASTGRIAIVINGVTKYIPYF